MISSLSGKYTTHFTYSNYRLLVATSQVTVARCITVHLSEPVTCPFGRITGFFFLRCAHTGTIYDMMMAPPKCSSYLNQRYFQFMALYHAQLPEVSHFVMEICWYNVSIIIVLQKLCCLFGLYLLVFLSLWVARIRSFIDYRTYVHCDVSVGPTL